jgi:hypothetical protein
MQCRTHVRLCIGQLGTSAFRLKLKRQSNQLLPLKPPLAQLLQRHGIGYFPFHLFKDKPCNMGRDIAFLDSGHIVSKYC